MSCLDSMTLAPVRPRGFKCLVVAGFRVVVEPPIGIEPMTYALREACYLAAHAVAAQIAPVIALMAPAALGLSGDPVHEPVHERSPCVPSSCYCA